MNGETGQGKTALVENLKELHLPAMRGCFEETARRSDRDESTCTTIFAVSILRCE